MHRERPNHDVIRTDVATAEPGDASRSSMLDLLSRFIVELREAGLPVSLTENLDAMAAIRHIPLEDREAFKALMDEIGEPIIESVIANTPQQALDFAARTGTPLVRQYVLDSVEDVLGSTEAAQAWLARHAPPAAPVPPA